MTRVGIVLFDEVEVLDACGPFEVFSVASRLHRPGEKKFDVVLLSAHDRLAVTARGGLVLTAGHLLSDAPSLDLLLVPGGVTTAVEQDPAVIDWLRRRTDTPVVASICTGAFLLAEAGLITDQQVTTHWEDQADLARRFPALDVIDDVRWVGGGNRYTSAGIAAGLDLSLHLVSELSGPDHAARTARQMDYPWTPGT